MAATDGPERIEIELRSRDASVAPGPLSVTSTANHDLDPRPPAGRGVVVPLVVGIVAMGAGWMIGRSGDASPTAAPAETTAIEATDPVGAIAPVPTTAVASAPAGAPADAPLEVPGSGAPTTVAPAPPLVDETEVFVAQRLRGQPVEIVAYGNGRQLLRLDLATSWFVTRDVTSQPFGRTRLLVGPTWALLPSNETGLDSTLVWDDGRTDEVDVGPAAQIIGVAGTGSLWTTAPDAHGGNVVQRRDVDGRTVEEFGVPAVPIAPDPAGGVVVDVPGGTFGVRPQPSVVDPATGAVTVFDPSVVPITDGRLLALGPEVAVAEECDDLLVCATFVIDRGSGERRSIAVGESSAGLVPYALAGAATVAPGGGAAVVEVLQPTDRASAQRSLGVVDLATGLVAEIGPTQDVGQTAWTPDGRFLLFIRGGRIAAHDIETGVAVVVADELVAIDAFGVRARGQDGGG